MYDIIIIGGGTAGLSAGIYSVRAGKSALILEKKTYGGQIINSPDVENYPGIAHISGFDFANGLYEQATSLGAEFKLEEATKIIDNGETKTVVTDEAEYECKAVIIATGATNRPIGLEREKELTGAGVSYCATCDGMFFRGKDVAVVGGGNTALEDAGFLSDICNKVYIIHRRDEFRGDESDVEKLRKKDNVEFVLDSVVTEILGENLVEGIKVKNVKTEEINELKINGLFVAIGQVPVGDIFSDIVKLSESGYIEAGEDCYTGVSGVYTAGDCRTKEVRQLATAAADGAVAALNAAKAI
ncbi:MAG: thioredoxin-disulfide reductase [Eubacterium sp.]|nr:thioredoxin-disulfide reductase [Eubacterium sp.]